MIIREAERTNDTERTPPSRQVSAVRYDRNDDK